MVIRPKHITIILILLLVASCRSQNEPKTKAKNPTDQIVGGPCEGCEAVHEYGGLPLKNSDTLPSFFTEDPKIKLTGTVYSSKNGAPADNVIIYAYHTDRNGIYPTKGDEKGWAKRHGYLRGWVRTDADGHYSFYTVRPASYPNRSQPEHIHLIVKEPGFNEYYIDDILFEDDPLLTQSVKTSRPNRGGSGIVRLERKEVLLVAKRDIFLGKNIPGY